MNVLQDYLDDLWKYNLDTLRWTQMKPNLRDGRAPKSRRGHSAVLYQGTMYVTGCVSFSLIMCLPAGTYLVEDELRGYHPLLKLLPYSSLANLTQPASKEELTMKLDITHLH